LTSFPKGASAGHSPRPRRSRRVSGCCVRVVRSRAGCRVLGVEPCSRSGSNSAPGAGRPATRSEPARLDAGGPRDMTRRIALMATMDVYPGKDLGTLELTITDEMVHHYI